jgi:hypothetical protein
MRPSRPSADARSKWRESELAAARTHPGGGHHGAPQVYWFRRVRRVEKVERIPNWGEGDVTTQAAEAQWIAVGCGSGELNC